MAIQKLGDAASFLVADPNALGRSMRASARSEKDGGLKAVAQQFEAIFLDMMLKSMRGAKLAESEFDGPGTSEFTHMMDQQLTAKLSRSGSLGLADLIVRQLSPHDSAAQGTVPVKNSTVVP
jgi:flagellar protein FlgJ